MDTKLKNTDRTAVLRTVYGLGWLVTALSGAACAILSSMAACLASMTDLKSYIQAGGDKQWAEGNPWFVDIPDMDAFSDVLANLITWAAVCGVILAASVVVLCVLTGRMGRNEDGSIHLNWFDRIWSELHIGGVCGFATAAVALCIPIMRIYALTSWTDVFVPSITVDHWFGPSNSFIVKLCIAGIMASVMLTVLCLVSLVKKLKARQFWEKSLLGGLFLFIYRGLKKSFKESDSTLIKTVCVLILGALLSATWFGLPVVVVLILIFVPRIVKKFTDIKTGVARVKGGDLAYKIPVEDDAQGVRGELDRLAADINDISEAAGLAVENELKNQRMKTELISNVSHDLKTPLTSMVSYVDLLKTEGLDSPNAPSYLEIIDEKTQRLRVLTEDLFEAAKASSGAIPVNMESIDLAALVSQSLGEMGEKLSAKGLDVIVKNEIEDSSAHGVGVMADGQLLWRVIENLLSNVSKYALEGSRVYVNISSPKDSKVLLEIKNISASELNISAEELMERFTRGDESRNTEGSGLGLAIAKEIVEQHGGSIHASSINQKIIFDVELPQTSE